MKINFQTVDCQRMWFVFSLVLQKLIKTNIMGLLTTSRTGSVLPSLVNNFFDDDLLLRPSLFDFYRDFPEMQLSTLPAVNIEEGEKDFRFELAAPGLDKKDFKIEVDNNYLVVSSEKKESKEQQNENYRIKEFSFRNFRRSFALPDNSIPEKISAQYENGILKLAIPKREVTVKKPAKEIKVG